MKKYILILLTSLFLVTSCDEEILNKKPLDIISEKDVWNDPALVGAYVANLYYSLPFLHMGDFVTQDATTMWEYALTSGISDESVMTRYFRTVPKIKLGNLNETGGVLEFWAYPQIRKMNEFYANIENSAMASDKKKLYIGSVKFVEAFTYFEMAKRYGAVPVITSAQQADDPKEELFPSRTPEVKVYDYALGLLDEIYKQGLLPKTGGSNGYPTMGAVLALKSRIGLYAASIARFSTVQLNGLLGVPKEDENRFWQAAYDASDELITKYPYSLYTKYPNDLENRIYRMSFDKDNPERIFVKSYDGENIFHKWESFIAPGGHVDMGFSNSNAPYLDFVESFQKIDGSSGVMPRKWQTDKTLLSKDEIFGKYDPRMRGSIFCEGSSLFGREVNFYEGLRLPNGSILKGETQTYNGVPAWGNARHQVPGAWMFTDFGIRKYVNEDFDQVLRQSSTDKIIFRLGEIYLNRAEAAFYLNNQEQARQDINTIRSRAGMPAHQSIDVDKIRYERMVELCFEHGNRYWDLIRWRTAVEKISKVFSGIKLIKDYETGKYLIEFIQYPGTAAPYYSSFSPRHYYKPITPNRIANNPNLAPENPGY